MIDFPSARSLRSRLSSSGVHLSLLFLAMAVLHRRVGPLTVNVKGLLWGRTHATLDIDPTRLFQSRSAFNVTALARHPEDVALRSQVVNCHGEHHCTSRRRISQRDGGDADINQGTA